MRRWIICSQLLLFDSVEAPKMPTLDISKPFHYDKRSNYISYKGKQKNYTYLLIETHNWLAVMDPYSADMERKPEQFKLNQSQKHLRVSLIYSYKGMQPKGMWRKEWSTVLDCGSPSICLTEDSPLVGQAVAREVHVEKNKSHCFHLWG